MAGGERGRGRGRGSTESQRGRGRGRAGGGRGRGGYTKPADRKQRETERTFEEDDEGWEQVNKHRAARVAPSQTS